jgi:RimJ/RimL family protein N-acetyltransferase
MVELMQSLKVEALRTRRLELRPLRPEHAVMMWEVLREGDLYTFIPRDPPGNVGEVQARFESVAVGHSRDRRDLWLNWTAWHRETLEPVGLFEATVHDDGRASLAYMVRPTLWRQGYAAEGLSVVIDALFAAGVTIAEAEIDTRNVASLSLVARLGFHMVERRENVEFFKGTWSHEELWRLPAAAASSPAER